MFIVSVCLRSSPTTLQFMFKDFIGAGRFKAAIQDRRRKTLTEEAVPEDEWSLDLADDYGHIFDCMIEEIGAVVLKDQKQSTIAAQEIAMMNARAQMELNAKVQSDPKMRFLGGASGLTLPNG